MKQRLSLRVLKLTALLLATVGTLVLWIVATRNDIPSLSIASANASTNMAYVALEGRCTRGPSYDPDGGYLSFWIDDGTGEAHVAAYRAEVEQLIAQGRVPAPGDHVEVAGTLRIREDYLSLTLNAPEQLHIERPRPVSREIGAIHGGDEYQRVRVRGRIRAIEQPYAGLTLVTLRDATGAIPLALSQDLIALSGASPTLTVGQSVAVTATVSLYREQPQLVPASLADVTPLAKAVDIAAARTIGTLTDADEGRLVRVQGRVSDPTPFSAGTKFALDDGSGRITVVLWDDVERETDAIALQPGAQTQVQGELSRYRGQLELIPELGADVQLIAAPAPPRPATVAALSARDVGRTVRIEGHLGSPRQFSAGTSFPLDDGTGQITLLLWDDLYQQLSHALDTGFRVAVTGEIAEYQGELEIVPQAAEDVQVLDDETDGAPAPSPTPHAITPIGEIQAGDVGQTRTVRGTLGAWESFSQGVKADLSDASGTIILLLWQEVYEALDAPALTPGTSVEVTGRIDEYRGEIEIIPDEEGVRILQ